MSLLHSAIEAFIGLGSNLGESVEHLQNARLDIKSLPGVEEIAFSPLYTSSPVGPQDQPDYVNAVMRIKTSLPALQLLRELQAIENAHGRERLVRWGARTLDLDILLYDQYIISEPDLKIPHPEMSNRAFVLYPLADIADLELNVPGYGRLRQLLAACPAEGIVRIAS
jgi:2-amino-4-hydroxy-6-hydroxymethyldihydropteridine diphosphokinase